MRVVLFCGGYGMRMRDGVNDIPKPMTLVGERPLLWHVMRYYAHFGHKDFILCLGFGAAHIKDYFLNYTETKSNDFILRRGGADIELLANDTQDWSITFIDTGLETAIGERLRRVRRFVDQDEAFLANYADVLTDAPLDTMISDFESHPQSVASLLAVPPQSAFHMVTVDDSQVVTRIQQVSEMPIRENGGYFIFSNSIFDHLREGEDLVGDTLTRLSHEAKVQAFVHDGFWMPADTVKERTMLEQMHKAGHRPWAMWERPL